MAPTEATVVTTTSPDGIPIACWRSGEGMPLVLVHGTSSDHARWDPALPAFAAHFTVYAMDQHGRGGSGDGPAYSIEREFEDVVAVVDSIGEPVHLLGHSYGALCALEAARRTPNIAKLVLYEAPTAVDPTSLPPGFIAELDGLVAEGRRDETVRRFFEVVVRTPPPEIERMRAQPMWATRVASAHTLPRETREVAAEASYRFEPALFADMRTPTLLMRGDMSAPFLKTSTEVVHVALPNSRIVVLTGQGHNPTRDGAEPFATEVLSFLL